MPSDSPETLEPLEPVLLSPVESYFWRFEEDWGGAHRVMVLLRLDGSMEAGFLAAALRQLQRRHPKLRAVIAKGGDGRLRYTFEQAAPPIPFEIIDCDGGETRWREETRRLLQIDFLSTGSLAAVTVLRSRSRGCCELLLTMPHTIADGLSAIMLVDDLLTEYARAEAHVEFTPCPALPVVTAARAKRSGGWRSRLRLLHRFTQLQREEKRSPLTSLPEARDIPPQSQWVHWVFSRADTLTLVRLCRKEQASLNGAMVAAACCGLMDCLPVPEGRFKWQLPFNVREVLEGSAGPVTPQDLGCFVSNMNGLLKATQQPVFWELARRVHRDVRVFIQRGGPSFGYNMASALYNMTATVSQWLVHRAPKLMPSSHQRETLNASYLGVLNIGNAYGSLRPRECTVTFKHEITGPSLVMEALILGQRLNIGFAADDLEPTFWEQLQVAVRERLDAAIKLGEPR